MSLSKHLEHLVMCLGSRASTPRDGIYMVRIYITKDVTDYVLPSDGYVSARFHCRVGIRNGLVNITTANSAASLAAQVQPYSTDSEISTAFFVCGRKGDTVRLTVKSDADLEWLVFIPSEGGVLKALFPRLCAVSEVSFGWKLWQAPAVGKTSQHTARVAVFKHFG